MEGKARKECLGLEEEAAVAVAKAQAIGTELSMENQTALENSAIPAKTQSKESVAKPARQFDHAMQI